MVQKSEFQLGKIRILLADDHSLVQKQLAIRLSSEPDLEMVGVASTSYETFKKIQEMHPHILLIDPLMRDGLGVATLRQVRVNFPEVVIVVLTAYVDTMLNLQFQQMGIKQILTKGVASSELLAAVREGVSANSRGNPEP